MDLRIRNGLLSVYVYGDVVICCLLLSCTIPLREYVYFRNLFAVLFLSLLPRHSLARKNDTIISIAPIE